jgi:hypothetical protein
MTAEFFILALTAAVNPSLVGVDLAVLMNRRPRAMLLCVLLAGVGIAIAIGLIDVLLIRANFVKGESGLGPGARVAIGLLLIGAGLLLKFGLPRRKRREPQAGGKPATDQPSQKKQSWTARALSEPRLGLAAVVGLVMGLPGAVYLTAMHHLATGDFSTANKVAAVVLFAIIEFALVIVPLILLNLRPEATAVMLQRWHKWLLSHGRALGAWVLIGLGAYLTITGLVNLVS